MRPQETKLRRTIAHVCDFGVKPLPLHELDVAARSATALMLHDVLHPHDLFREVIHRTSYYRSGWGVRSLNVEEQEIVFGFPAWLRAGGVARVRFFLRSNPNFGRLPLGTLVKPSSQRSSPGFTHHDRTRGLKLHLDAIHQTIAIPCLDRFFVGHLQGRQA
jgi:hypothetical protein